MRVYAGRWLNGEARISLGDHRGIERLRLLVDSDDVPRIEMLNEYGEVIHCISPDEYDPPRLPSLESVPTDATGRTPAHLLGVFDNDLGKALAFLDEPRVRKILGEAVLAQWKEWLLEAERMNQGGAKNTAEPDRSSRRLR